MKKLRIIGLMICISMMGMMAGCASLSNEKSYVGPVESESSGQIILNKYSRCFEIINSRLLSKYVNLPQKNIGTATSLIGQDSAGSILINAFSFNDKRIDINVYTANKVPRQFKLSELTDGKEYGFHTSDGSHWIQIFLINCKASEFDINALAKEIYDYLSENKLHPISQSSETKAAE